MSDIKEKFGIGYLIRDDKTPATFEAPQGNALRIDPPAEYQACPACGYASIGLTVHKSDCGQLHGNVALFEEQRAEIARLQAKVVLYERSISAIESYDGVVSDAIRLLHESVAYVPGCQPQDDAADSLASRWLEIKATIAQQAARIRELESDLETLEALRDYQLTELRKEKNSLEGEAARLAAIINGDRDLRYIKRLLENNADLAQQVADLTAANELLQEIVTNGHDEQWDATDAACACWWRGDDHGAVKVAEMVLSWPGITEDLKRRLLPIVKLSGNILMPATAAPPNPFALAIDRAHSGGYKLKRDDLPPLSLPSFAQDGAEKQADSPEGTFLPPSVAVGEPGGEKG